MNIQKMIEKVDGFLSPGEANLLFSLANNCSVKGAIVEIGSWKGKSTICLASGSKAGKKSTVYAIDPHTGSPEHKKRFGKVWTFEEFKENIKKAKVNDLVVPLVKTSEEAAKKFDKPVELIFIDGAHEYESVKQDFELWFPKVIEGGIMAFHDTTNWPGPKKLVKEAVFKSKHFRNIGFVNSITYGKKIKQNTLKDRIKNEYVLLLKTIYESADKLKLPKPIRVLGNKIIKKMQ